MQMEKSNTFIILIFGYGGKYLRSCGDGDSSTCTSYEKDPWASWGSGASVSIN